MKTSSDIRKIRCNRGKNTTFAGQCCSSVERRNKNKFRMQSCEISYMSNDEPRSVTLIEILHCANIKGTCVWKSRDMICLHDRRRVVVSRLGHNLVEIIHWPPLWQACAWLVLYRREDRYKLIVMMNENVARMNTIGPRNVLHYKIQN